MLQWPASESLAPLSDYVGTRHASPALTQRGVEDLAGQRRDVLGEGRAGQENGALVGKVVAVVVEEVVGVHAEPRGNLLQKLQENLFWDV